ncbi:MAG: hypothetical protein QN152_12070 [Armatimonadota bacterium]|nr:hypothetical protein [Armatimonadota bacterium]MDR7426414.1 hypothetical protein [Armatimonadota bacterium]MDR7540244.1 hypothetical protein [Armatimonadota bacterium]
MSVGAALLAWSHPLQAQLPGLPVDLQVVSGFALRAPRLLPLSGYEVHYSYEAPEQQEASFARAAPQAEFDTITVKAPAGEIDEVRFSRADEPYALIIRPIAGAPVGSWDAPAGGRLVPAPPPEGEVRRRFALAAGLFGQAREALGLKAFRGGPSGTVTLQLRGVEDLLLRSPGPEADYEYRFFGLGQEGMLEDLRAEVPGARYAIEYGPARLAIRRESAAADGTQAVAELAVEGGAWQGSVQIRRPGTGQTTEPMARAAAEQLLAEGLSHLRAARTRVQITFGRDLGAVRLP